MILDISNEKKPLKGKKNKEKLKKFHIAAKLSIVPRKARLNKDERITARVFEPRSSSRSGFSYSSLGY